MDVQYLEEPAMTDPLTLTSDLDQMARWVLARKIGELELSVRAENVLHYAGVKTVGDLVLKTSRDILLLRNGTRKMLAEIVEALAEMGLELEKEA